MLDSTDTSDTETTHYLLFRVGSEHYCVLLNRVYEIRRWRGATRVPNAPPDIRGVIKVRGNVVPIVDLRHRFDLPAIELDNTNIVLLLEVQDAQRTRLVGLLIDEVLRDEALPDRAAADPASWHGAPAADYIRSVLTSNEGQELLLLDTTKLLHDALSFAVAQSA